MSGSCPLLGEADIVAGCSMRASRPTLAGSYSRQAGGGRVRNTIPQSRDRPHSFTRYAAGFCDLAEPGQPERRDRTGFGVCRSVVHRRSDQVERSRPLFCAPNFRVSGFQFRKGPDQKNCAHRPDLPEIGIRSGPTVELAMIWYSNKFFASGLKLEALEADNPDHGRIKKYSITPRAWVLLRYTAQPINASVTFPRARNFRNPAKFPEPQIFCFRIETRSRTSGARICGRVGLNSKPPGLGMSFSISAFSDVITGADVVFGFEFPNQLGVGSCRNRSSIETVRIADAWPTADADALAYAARQSWQAPVAA